MKKRMIVLLSLLLLLGGMLLARDNTILKVRVQTANVRSDADATAPVIAKVTVGTLLEASGRDGAWFEVTVTNASGKETRGYIHNSVVDVLGDDNEDEARPRAAARSQAPATRAPKKSARGGVKLMGGLSMGNLNFSEDISASIKKSSKMGFMGGLGFESGGRIAIELDLLYSPGGTVLKNANNPESNAKVTISGAAVTAPVLLKIRFMPGTTPYILAGGEVGYVLNQKVILTAEDGTESEEDITDTTNRLLYGVVFGGGLELQAGGMNLLLEARYRLGLSNLIKDPEPGAYIKATALSFLVAIKF